MEGGGNSGSLIVIGAVVVLGLIGTAMFAAFMMRQKNHQRILEAKTRHAKMMELSNQANDDAIPVK